ncbi:VOC family protein [Microbispora sp. H10885]|uniref:VOC family protein n=1 Tax=Microbispora sp. H10885 TaxID=2729110 RepID=UPI00160098FE|nr:VOC family protein [Microbispora sp. H10885]
MLRGLSTVSFYADDVTAAARWYAGLLGVEPYFTRSVEGTLAYAEFRIGDHEDELGVVDSRFAPRPRPDEPAGAVVYWHVDDVEAAVDRLLALGATTYEKPVERGPGFVTASVVDPFGNVLGVMYNRHFLEVSGR